MLGTENYDKAAVLAEQGSNPAIASLQASLPDALLDAKFDRGELTLKVAREHIREAAALVQQAGYNFLEDVTCVDYFPAEPRFQVIYHILSHSLKARVRLAAPVDSAEMEIASITSVWPSADFYEREVFDLFGVTFHNHPEMERILLPADWEGHPLRKDYPITGNRV